MRLLLAASAATLALLLLPAAAAQMMSPVLQARIQVDSEPIAAGNATAMRLTLLRLCPNAATVYDAQTAGIVIQTNDASNWTVTGPLQGHFPQQVCAQQMEQPLEILYEIRASPDAAAEQVEVHPFTLKVRLEHASATTPGSAESYYPFTLSTQARPAPAVVEEEPQREMPGLGLAGSLAALAVLAIVARRR